MTKPRINLFSQGTETALELLTRQGYTLSCCGGVGLCGRCQIRYIKNATLPTLADRKFFTPLQLREGYRLACKSKPVGQVEVELYFIESKEKIVTYYHENKQQEDEYFQIPENNMNGIETFLATDIGTTTIAMLLVEKNSGRVLDTYRSLNPQRIFGKDIISRIQASVDGNREKLEKLIREKLEEGIEKLCKNQDIVSLKANYPMEHIIAGNTTMIQLLMGYDVEQMAGYPFTPLELNLIHSQIKGIKTVILPGISAFVGGDIVAGIYYTGMFREEKPSLLIDLGTNGEIALGNKDRLLVTATAAGPAFEGGPTASIIGTDMISMAAKMLNEKIISSTGQMEDSYFETGYEADGICITQNDIRSLQMAKAAIYAGITILMEKYQVTGDMLEKVYLAGGFGYYLDAKKAQEIGLIPEQLAIKILPVGNSSLAGAIAFGRMDEKKREEIKNISIIAEEINLAREEVFMERYLGALSFPE